MEEVKKQGTESLFVPYAESLELKELGFDEPCLGAWAEHGFMTPNDVSTLQDDVTIEDIKNTQDENMCLSPLYQQAFRWFRVKHKLVHQITSLKYKGGVNFDYDIFSLVLPTDDELGDEDDVASDKSMETYDSLVEKDFRHDESESYEEAELACLRQLIKIVNNG